MKFQFNQLSLLLALLLTLFFVIACGSTKGTSASAAKNKKKSQSFFYTGEEVAKDESYAHIVNSVARLRAMLSGLFVQYNNRKDKETEEQKWVPWTVNDGKDSVLLYVFPVGEPNKIGYWMHEYQYMTSLPDEPIHQMFVKLVEVNRDTIRAVYYDTPSDFEMPLAELIENPKKAFEQIDVETLELSTTDEPVTYVRENPLLYNGLGALEEDDILKERNPGGFKCRYLVIKPQYTYFGWQGYDKDKKVLGQMPPTKLQKEAMIRTDLPPK